MSRGDGGEVRSRLFIFIGSGFCYFVEVCFFLFIGMSGLRFVVLSGSFGVGKSILLKRFL